MSADNISACPKCYVADGFESYEFREYYDIGMDKDGNFSIDYQGQCRDCGFSFAFLQTQQVDTHDH